MLCVLNKAKNLKGTEAAVPVFEAALVPCDKGDCNRLWKNSYSPNFQYFLLSLTFLLNAFMGFLLAEVGKHTDFSGDFQQIEDFRVMDSCFCH